MPSADPFRLDLSPTRLAQARAELATRGHVQIAAALPAAQARALHDHLGDELEWWRTVNQGDKTWDLGPESIAAMSDGGDAPLQDAVWRGARDGFQFLFDRVRVSDDPAERSARGLLLDRAIDALNRPDSLALFRRLTGDADVRLIDGQATRYQPGHFLTGHDDAVGGKDRVAAYVLGLTPAWRVQWGGLLQFHDAAGDIARALLPRFNVLNVFAVPQVHSVSLVAPFAGAPRYAITGWIRR